MRLSRNPGIPRKQGEKKRKERTTDLPTQILVFAERATEKQHLSAREGSGKKRKKKKSKKGDLEETSSRLSCQQTTPLPRSSAQRFSQPRGDGQTDAPPAPTPTPHPPPPPAAYPPLVFVTSLAALCVRVLSPVSSALLPRAGCSWRPRAESARSAGKC
ncbi:uncharacterized protein [Odocoileus virginianus]|uniref:Uncharacterized protein n=1 Tax=Odocoileus virginianus TaxID=9874 RepID=A0ABM4IEL3_ODOVR